MQLNSNIQYAWQISNNKYSLSEGTIKIKDRLKWARWEVNIKGKWIEIDCWETMINMKDSMYPCDRKLIYTSKSSLRLAPFI